MPVRSPGVRAFLHKPSSTISYLVFDTGSRRAAVIDPAVDFDLATGRLGTDPVTAIAAEIDREGLHLDWIIETHVHADHVSGAQYLKEACGGRIAIGRGITAVQETFAGVYGLGPEFARDGSQFDHLFTDSETFSIGEIVCRAIATPGHTPACTSYLCGDALFVGDTVFMPDFGTARCDFPGGSAKDLYRSAHRLMSLDGDTRVFVGHDYGPGGREIAWETTIGEQRTANKHVREGVSEAEFVEMRTQRDAQLGLPGMIVPAIQINMRGGRLPTAEANGIAYLKIPVNAFPGA